MNGERHLNIYTFSLAAGGSVPSIGHTAAQLEQASILSNSTIKVVFVDLGYRGVDQQNPDVSIKHRGKCNRLNDKERGLLKRRQAIEPIIDT
jgi:transposase, IS5 family